MKFKSTYFLIIITILFGSYIYFIEIKKTEKDEVIKAEAQRIIKFDQNSVRKLTFNSSFGKYVLEKDAQNIWQMTSPVQDLADESTMTALFSALSGENYDQIVTEDMSHLKEFGLDKPSLSLEIYFGTGETKTIQVGQMAPLAGKVYVKLLSDKKVLLANASIKYQIDKGMRELRDKKIFRASRDEIAKIKIKSLKNGEIELNKIKQEWHITKPYQELADGEAVLNLINSIDGLRASDFSAENTSLKDLKKFNLEKPETEITLYNSAAKVLDLLLIGAKKENNSYVRTKNLKTIFQIYASSGEQFVKTASDYRDKKSALAFEKDQVKAFSIKTALVDYSFVKKGDSWELSKSDPKKEVNQLQVSQLLNKLSEMKVAEYIDKPVKFGTEKGKIMLKDEKGQTLLDFKWGEKTPSGKNILVSTDKIKKPFGVDTGLVTTLPGQTLIEEKK